MQSEHLLLDIPPVVNTKENAPNSEYKEFREETKRERNAKEKQKSGKIGERERETKKEEERQTHTHIYIYTYIYKHICKYTNIQSINTNAHMVYD